MGWYSAFSVEADDIDDSDIMAAWELVIVGLMSNWRGNRERCGRRNVDILVMMKISFYDNHGTVG